MECEDGYDLIEQNKDSTHQIWGKQTCSKCKVKNCATCSRTAKGGCGACKYGYGFDGKGACQKCTDVNCNACGKDYRTCDWCNFGDPPNSPAYGLVVTGSGKKKKSKCMPCPKGCYNCDGDGKCHDDRAK